MESSTSSKLSVVSRVFHLTSTGFLSATTILNYFFNINDFLKEDESYWGLAYPFAGVLAITTGLINVYILRP